MEFLKRLAARLPDHWQNELKRFQHRRQIRKGTFDTWEPEFNQLEKWINQGDWVIDIGANIGHYTNRLSTLVGPQGRVIAFEPIPETFALLSAGLQHAACANVTLLNAAASEHTAVVGMAIPKFGTGLKNFYEAHVTEAHTDANASSDNLSVLALRIDSLALPHRVSLVKIDAEGHEFSVLNGMLELLRRDHPTLIVENPSKPVLELLAGLGYGSETLAGSPNTVFR